MKWEDIARARSILEKEDGYTFSDWGGRLPVALAYANTYQVAMSNLGFQTVYQLFNAHPHVVCERVFWPGRTGMPLITLESQRDVLDCAVLAVSLSFELDYFNLVDMLAQLGMPLRASERDETWPLVLAGGPAISANPEPLADICDAFFIGEAETSIAPMSDLLWDLIDAPRAQVLEALTTIPGVYVPDLSPLPVERQWLTDLDAYPTNSVVLTADTEFGDMYLIEVSRGCAHGCRFCLAGHTYRPFRYRSLDTILAQAREALSYRTKVGLVGAAISDYPQIGLLVDKLLEMGLTISVSSLRIRPLPIKLVQALAASGARTLTLAPEAGCDRLRRVIRKGVSEVDILQAVALAQEIGFPALKFYFMLGLPTETEEDVQAIVDLMDLTRQRFSGDISINASCFVPKAHTPFQWEAMADLETLEARQALLQEQLRPMRIQVRGDSPAWAQVQGVLARGDRQLGEVLIEMGGRTSLRVWNKTLRKHGLDPARYLAARPLDETLPWQVVTGGTPLDLLCREQQHAHNAQD